MIYSRMFPLVLLLATACGIVKHQAGYEMFLCAFTTMDDSRDC